LFLICSFFFFVFHLNWLKLIGIYLLKLCETSSMLVDGRLTHNLLVHASPASERRLRAAVRQKEYSTPPDCASLPRQPKSPFQWGWVAEDVFDPASKLSGYDVFHCF
jgi:hypothetical protein